MAKFGFHHEKDVEKVRHATIYSDTYLVQSFREDRKRGAFMKKIAVFLPMAILIACASAAWSQSLADLAKKEKERRSEIKDNRVITDEEVTKFRSTDPEPASPDQPSATTAIPKSEGEPANAAKAEKPSSDEPTDFTGRSESYWRKTMAEARQKIIDLTNEGNVITLTIAELQNKFYSMDDGFNRETIQRDLQKNYYKQDMNKENLEKAKSELQDLENEARKSGALPGWIEP
jgi:hypothetical protein